MSSNPKGEQIQCLIEHPSLVRRMKRSMVQLTILKEDSKTLLYEKVGVEDNESVR